MKKHASLSICPESSANVSAGRNPPVGPVQDFEARVAEAAYFRAERREFAPGFELDDWLAAEAEIRAQRRASS